MCWSATADLTAGAVITAVGLVCVVRLRRARDLPVAALPLLLGAHQLVEAAVWNSGGGCSPAATAWVVIAMPLLAVWVPFGVLLAAGPGAGVDVPYLPLVLAGYLGATLGALLLAGDRRLRLLGAVLAAGAVACAALWRLEFASTWCGLAAVTSLLVLGWVRRREPAGPVT
ncbi:DUF6629 family protein [Streptomyces sp. NBC_01408]|uniref:DUF6629 family protein n=1 Tax=Streptomyces sp. NBC_01408 TaxID=2903855 RepID=UPI00225B4557|nr:DUF6629 family protein [Streptomyces sp. NBC_01408]MCX4695215.1 hypothetical protein [Streptomyces sp. NBC_01408]